MTFAECFRGLHVALRRRDRIHAREVDRNELVAWLARRRLQRVVNAYNRRLFVACKPCYFAGRVVRGTVFVRPVGRELCGDCAAREEV